MNHFHPRRARMRAALAAVIAATAVFPAAAGAATITDFKAGPVPSYNNGAGVPFIPAPAPAGPSAPTGNPGTATISADTNCTYGEVQTGLFVTESTPTWQGQGPAPALGTTTSNVRAVYSTAGPDKPLTLSTQAGAYSDYCVAFRTTAAGHPHPSQGGERAKQTIVELPVGVAAAIDPQAKCSEADFKRHRDPEDYAPNTCARNTQVGTAMIRLRVPAPVTPLTPDGSTVRDSPGRVYALETPANQAARFGVVLLGGSRLVDGTAFGGNSNVQIPDRQTKFAIDVSQAGVATIALLNATDDLGVFVPNSGGTQANGAPCAPGAICTIPIQLHGAAFRFWGEASKHPHKANPADAAEAPTLMATDFLRMPTTCQKDLTSKLTVVPYTAGDSPLRGAFALYPGEKAQAEAAQSAVATSNAVRLTGCEALPFNPTFKADLVGDTAKGNHVGLNIAIDVPEGNDDLGATRITLPDGVVSDLDNVKNSCLPADFVAIKCAPETIIGNVTATLSGIDADVVKGDIHMVRVEGQTLPALGFNFKGRLPLRLSGMSQIDSNGRIVNTFVDLPSIPQRTLRVALAGGPKSILRISTARCAVSAFDAQLTSQNGKAVSFKQRTRCDAEFRATLKRADTSRPYLNFNGAGATGKKIKSLRLTLPPGVTIRRGNTNKRTKVSALEETVTKNTSRRRIGKKLLRISIPQTGSNGLKLLTRSKLLITSKKFRKRDDSPNLLARIVYTDGTKTEVRVPLERD